MSKIYVIELQGCGLYGANVYIDRAEAEASLEKYYSHSGARIIEFDRSTPVAAEAATAKKLIACVPSNWLDPLLTGDDRVKPYDCDKYNSRQIEELLHRIRERMQKVAAAPTKDSGKVEEIRAERDALAAENLDLHRQLNARDSGPKGAEATEQQLREWEEQNELSGFTTDELRTLARTAPRAAEELPSAAVDTTLRFALVEIINEMRRNMPNSAWAAQIERLLKMNVPLNEIPGWAWATAIGQLNSPNHSDIWLDVLDTVCKHAQINRENGYGKPETTPTTPVHAQAVTDDEDLWIVVPREPTPEMLRAGFLSESEGFDIETPADAPGLVWRAMVAASPDFETQRLAAPPVELPGKTQADEHITHPETPAHPIRPALWIDGADIGYIKDGAKTSASLFTSQVLPCMVPLYLAASLPGSSQQAAHGATAAADELYGDGRCEVCGWTLAETWEKGCVPGNCSFRPEHGSPEWRRIQNRREALARIETRQVEKNAALADQNTSAEGEKVEQKVVAWVDGSELGFLIDGRKNLISAFRTQELPCMVPLIRGDG